MVNAISVDVEEYFHATNLDPYIGRTRWDSAQSRAKECIEKMLNLFERTNTSATLFILGDFAKKNKQLVEQMSGAGHEIASHGMNHQLVYNLSQKEFLSELSDSKKLLEDLSGKAVLGYRAPNFSITERTPWAYDCLLESGYLYDSSVYPVWHPRYANAQEERNITKVETENGELWRIPLAAAEIELFGKSIRLPVAGGAYWRHFPMFFLKWGLRRINKHDNLAFCCYFHPWEIDSGQPLIQEMPFITRLRHYGGIERLEKRIENFLTSFEFSTVLAMLKEHQERLVDKSE